MGDARRCATCGGEIPAEAPGGACPRCALAAALPGAAGDPTPDDVAAKLPAFEILGVLGRGGMGVVFQARQKALDRVVALKVLPPATANAPGFSERFAREAKAMARLAHPNIVAVHDFGETDGLFWLVLEYVDGMNVREAMRAGRIGAADALTIVPQICDALQYAHDRGVVHRDIKPENVLIGRDGRVKIADFGLAKLADRDTGDPSLTGASQVMGTLHYMAPEQWERPKEVDHRADIYSLGVVFYEMLTGELPVGKFEPPSRKAAIDVRVDEVVMRSIERDRERRWQNASDVKTKVGEIASGVVAAPPPPPTWVAPPPGVHPPSIVPGTALLLVGAASLIPAFSFGEGWWVLTSLALIGGVVMFILRHERMRKLGLLEPDWHEIERRKEALDPPKPRGPVLTQRAVVLVTGAAVAACAVLCNGANFASDGFAWIGPVVPMFVLGLALWTMYDARKTAVRDAERGERDHPGPPLAIEIVAGCMILLGVLGVGQSLLAGHDKRPAATDDHAPWEFDTSVPDGEDSQHEPRDADRQAIWRTWSRAQAVQGAWSSDVRAVYASEDGGVLDRMMPALRDQQAKSGSLGPPLLPLDTTPLAKFDVVRARFGGWNETAHVFADASVEASDGKRTLRFAMHLDPGSSPSNPSWLFVAAPVDLK
jgi:hypothetical protein